MSDKIFYKDLSGEYYAEDGTVRNFQDECDKNEALQSACERLTNENENLQHVVQLLEVDLAAMTEARDSAKQLTQRAVQLAKEAEHDLGKFFRSIAVLESKKSIKH